MVSDMVGWSESRWKKFHTNHPLKLVEKTKEKLNICVRGGIGSPISVIYDQIEMNVYEGTFLLL